jgi:hypothetical protein
LYLVNRRLSNKGVVLVKGEERTGGTKGTKRDFVECRVILIVI